MTDSSAPGGNVPEFDREASIGGALLRLQVRTSDAQRQPDWVNRRVEQLEFIDTRAVRWQVSIDFNVPEGAPRIRRGDEEFRLVPITSLAKTNLVRFSMRDETSAAVWMPTSQETARYLVSALVHWASQELRIKDKELPQALVQDLERIVSGDPRGLRSRPPALLAIAALIDANRRYRRALRKFKETRPQREGTPLRPLKLWYQRQLQCESAERELGTAAEVQRQATERCRGVDENIRPLAYRLMASRDFRSQVEELTQNFVVHVPVKSAPRTRRIIKLAYESYAPRRRGPGGRLRKFWQSLGWRLWQFDVLIGGRGGSYHLEVAAPPGVDVIGITADRLKAREPGLKVKWWRRFTTKVWWRRLILWEPAADASVPGGLPHVHINPPEGADVRYRAAIFVRVSRPGWLTASWLVALVIAIVLGAGRFNLPAVYAKGQAPEASTAATLLLALLAVFATLLIRPGEHPLASRLLRVARLLVLLDAAVVLVAVGNLVLHSSQHPIPVTIWTWLAIVACAVLVLFTISWLLPVAYQPHGE
jgi:hypothetical protein